MADLYKLILIEKYQCYNHHTCNNCIKIKIKIKIFLFWGLVNLVFNWRKKIFTILYVQIWKSITSQYTIPPIKCVNFLLPLQPLLPFCLALLMARGPFIYYLSTCWGVKNWQYLLIFSTYTVKIISDTHNPYGMASNFLLGSQIRIRVEFRLLIKQ